MPAKKKGRHIVIRVEKKGKKGTPRLIPLAKKLTVSPKKKKKRQIIKSENLKKGICDVLLGRDVAVGEEETSSACRCEISSNNRVFEREAPAKRHLGRGGNTISLSSEGKKNEMTMTQKTIRTPIYVHGSLTKKKKRGAPFASQKRGAT